MNALVRDLRYTIRTMAANRGFVATAVFVLALGIAANVLIFSVVDAVLLRSLPVPESDRIVMVFESNLERHTREAVAGANFIDWRDQSHSFESIAAYEYLDFNLTGSDSPERVQGIVTTAELFRVLGVTPMIGRVLQSEDENRGTDRVVVISRGLWERRFGANPAIVGQKFVANAETLTIIGVMPADFSYPREAELWIPPRQTVPERVLNPTVNMASNRDSHYLHTIARLNRGLTLDQARTEIEVVARRIEEQNPDENRNRGVALLALRDYEVGDVRTMLLVLSAAVGFVLLIACANVANLLLARATTRQKEIAIRTALGASRFRLVRQLLTESVLLALLGGAIGILLALWGVNPLVAMMPAGIYGAKQIGINGAVVAFTVAVSLGTGVVFGLVPALQATKSDLNESLKEGGRSGGAGSRGNRARNLLVVCEIASSLVLLIGAGLLIKSFVRLMHVDPGFETRGVLTMKLSLPAVQYPDAGKRATFFEQVIARLKSTAGVESAAAISRLPLTSGNSSRGFSIEGRQTDGASGPGADYRVISSDYFRAMGISLLKGRAFTDRDTTNSPGVAIINQTAAARYWADEDPVGRRIRIDNGDPWMEIVGVVQDVKHLGLDSESRAEMYVPYQKDPWPFMTIIVRSNSDPAAMAAVMRNEVWAVDKDLPIPDVKTNEQLLADSVARRRFNMLLLSIFGAMALALAAVGIYGVMSYSVTQRSHEIGIRMALGAKQTDVLRLVVGQGAILTVAGVGTGIIAAFGLTRLMKSLLFAVDSTDPLTFVVISLGLMCVALAACFGPALRATKVDPIVALRYE
jgi:putative ABC transport system permease protein